jgi:hypothetical protein
MFFDQARKTPLWNLSLHARLARCVIAESIPQTLSALAMSMPGLA